MDPPPDYKEVVTETNAVRIPSAPSYARVFPQQTAQQAGAFVGELEWKEIHQEKGRHFSAYANEKTSNISIPATPTTESPIIMYRGGRRLFDREVIISQDLETDETTTAGSEKPIELDVRYLERQKIFSNRVAVHGYSERFQDEEEDCNKVVWNQSSSRQAVSIPEKAFVGKSNQNSETVLNQAQMGRYFYEISNKEEQQRISFDKENGKKQQPPLENRVVTVQPLSTSFVEQNDLRSQNKSPVRSHSLSPRSGSSTNREKRRESYIYSETRDVGVQAEAGLRNTATGTYCFINLCFCMSCKCALCSSSCSCTWLHCVPCLAYTVLCCPFWFVCLLCSFINPCWKEILLVTSGVLKHLAFSCKSVAGNNCSFTCLADDVEETLWNARRWGCGFEEAEKIV